MTRLVELHDLYVQAEKHALIAEQTGFLGTAKALRAVAREIEREREDLLASNPLEAGREPKIVRLRLVAGG